MSLNPRPLKPWLPLHPKSRPGFVFLMFCLVISVTFSIHSFFPESPMSRNHTQSPYLWSCGPRSPGIQRGLGLFYCFSNFHRKESLNMNTFILLSPVGSAQFNPLKESYCISSQRRGISRQDCTPVYQERTLQPAPKSHQLASILYFSFLPSIRNDSGTQRYPGALCSSVCGTWDYRECWIYSGGLGEDGACPSDHSRGMQAQPEDPEYR